MFTPDWLEDRNDDMTAPYAYHYLSWVAYDDELSVAVKVSTGRHRSLSDPALRLWGGVGISPENMERSL